LGRGFARAHAQSAKTAAAFRALVVQRPGQFSTEPASPCRGLGGIRHNQIATSAKPRFAPVSAMAGSADDSAFAKG